MPTIIDCVELTQDLIRCPSITPADAGCLDILEKVLTDLGFHCQRLPFGRVDNLYARWGTHLPNFCFAGHTDVVPVPDETLWSVPPFAAMIQDDKLYGRGAVDMKGAIGAYVAALSEFLQTSPQGSLSLLLTSDEEGPAVDGTVKVLNHLKAQGEMITACLVGEPTSTHRVGDIIKVGRRGSLNVDLSLRGTSGHAAYPHNNNAIHPFIRYLATLLGKTLDMGYPEFDPSHIQIVSVDVGNTTYNLIPETITARVNIRFNPLHTGDSLKQWLEDQADGLPIHVEVRSVSESFYRPDPQLIDHLQKATESVTGTPATLSTSGGTSDARFIKDISPVAELGLKNATAHKVDEHVPLADLRALQQIYLATLRRVFG